MCVVFFMQDNAPVSIDYNADVNITYNFNILDLCLECLASI